MEIHIEKRTHVSFTSCRTVKTNFVDEALWRYLYRKPRCRTILDKYRRRCRLFRFAQVQYVVLGPRIKIIILNILCESNRHELKFTLKIAFVLLTIIFKWQAPNGNIFLVIRKKVDRARGSLVRESHKQYIKSR